MSSIKFTFIAGILLAVAFVFSCGEVSDEGSASTNSAEEKCGGSPLKSSQFCYAETVQEKCGGENGKTYNPLDSFCYQGNVLGRCGGTAYDDANDFCDEGRIYAKCNGSSYIPLNQFCNTAVTPHKVSDYAKCNGTNFDDNIRFCFENTTVVPPVYEVIDKCNGKIYNPLDSFCYDYDGSVDVLAKRCGGSRNNGGVAYDTLSYFCFNNAVYDKCGGKTYNPLDSFCYDKKKVEKKCKRRNDGSYEEEYYDTEVFFCSEQEDLLYTKCNGNEFNTLEYFCRGASIVEYEKCGNKKYDDTKEFCRDGNTYRKCNNTEFDPNKNFCFENVLYTKCKGNGVKKCNQNGWNDPNGETLENTEEKGCFNPMREGCFQEKLYPLCAIDGVLGPCAQGTLLRCKQAGGSSANHAVTPLFGECSDKGVIEGMIEGMMSNIKTVQIGSQVWMAENLKLPMYNVSLTVKTTVTNKNADHNLMLNFSTRDTIFESYGAYGIRVTNTYHYVESYAETSYSTDNSVTIISATVPNNSSNTTRVLAQPTRAEEYDKIKMFIDHYDKDSSFINTENLPPTKDTYIFRDSIITTIDSIYSIVGPSAPQEIFYWRNGGACTGCPNDNNNSTTVPVENRKGLCPDGWRVPSSKDWKDLIDYAGGAAAAGNMLKSTSGWSGNGNGLDSYGFNAKPVLFESDAAYPILPLNSNGAFWWTSTTAANPNSDMAKFRYVISSDTEAKEVEVQKDLYKFSVRCLQNINVTTDN